MTKPHLAVRFAPTLAMCLWAVAAVADPNNELVFACFAVVVGVAFFASEVEVHEWRTMRRYGRWHR